MWRGGLRRELLPATSKRRLYHRRRRLVWALAEIIVTPRLSNSARTSAEGLSAAATVGQEVVEGANDKGPSSSRRPGSQGAKSVHQR
jgi:hypothetical protein